MKQKKYLILAATAALFAACTSDESPTAPEEQTGAMPVAFDTYVNRPTTRAGAGGETNNTDALKPKGFGIFAYYTNSDLYDPIFQPNFMYNQKVIHDGSNWTYAPVKYWPNEYASANAEENDKVSFFAYAPYVACSPVGKVADNKDYGIVGFSRNTAAGDPFVNYVASFDLAKQVDLLWGVVGTGETTWVKKDGNQTLTAGRPWLDIEHPAALNQKMTFTFNHALSKLLVDVDLCADAADAANAAAKTKVFIRSVTFTGFATKGALSLNNSEENKPLWLSTDGLTDIESGQEITIYDGRKDGKEGLFAATNEKAFINPKLTQTALWDEETQPGVTATAVNLFNTSVGSIETTDPIFVIPTGDEMKVTIVYDVMTEDASLPGYLNDGKNHGSVVPNKITKTITTTSGSTTTPITLVGAKTYKIHLHIGLQSVVVDAVVVDNWTDGGVGDADLPEN